jgi:hypothetical protein
MMATVKWESGGAASWTAGRNPVGTLQIGSVTIRILPGQSLQIEDRLKPEEWRVWG